MNTRTCRGCLSEFEFTGALQAYCTGRCRRDAGRLRRAMYGITDPVKSLNGRIGMAVRYGHHDEVIELRRQLARWHRERAHQA